MLLICFDTLFRLHGVFAPKRWKLSHFLRINFLFDRLLLVWPFLIRCWIDPGLFCELICFLSFYVLFCAQFKRTEFFSFAEALVALRLDERWVLFNPKCALVFGLKPIRNVQKAFLVLKLVIIYQFFVGHRLDGWWEFTALMSVLRRSESPVDNCPSAAHYIYKVFLCLYWPSGGLLHLTKHWNYSQHMMILVQMSLLGLELSQFLFLKKLRLLYLLLDHLFKSDLVHIAG